MALPLNRFKTFITSSLEGITPSTVYEAPVGYNAVLLAINACNTSELQKTVTVKYERNGGTVDLVNAFPIPSHDTSDLTTGKIIVEQGDSIQALATDASVHLTLSVLETKI